MSLIAMQDLLQYAGQNQFAVAAFSVRSIDVVNGILQAAERTQSPVVINLDNRQLQPNDMTILLAAIEAAARLTSIPVAIQADHIDSLSKLTLAINSGCNSLMLAENCQNSADIIKTARSCGLPVADRVPEENDLNAIADKIIKPAMDFGLVTADSVHGKNEGELIIDYEQLKAINEKLGLPLIIQASPELSADQCQKLIEHGITRIDFGSVLYDAVNAQIRNNAEDGRGDYQRLVKGVQESASAEAEVCIRLCQCAGQAAAVLETCTPWLPVEHLIIFNVKGLDEAGAEAMMAEGRKNLAQIPGVTQIGTGSAIKQEAQFRYAWLIRFCHPAVIDSYREHPAHVAFADNLFRPIAGDRISIDYLWSRELTQETAAQAPVVND